MMYGGGVPVFRNIGRKIMALAQFVCWAGIILSVISGLFMLPNNRTFGVGMAVIIIGSLSAWVGSWTLYAFGQLTDDTHALRVTNDRGARSRSGDPADLRARYQSARDLLQGGQFIEAARIFDDLIPYEDASLMWDRCVYLDGLARMEAGEYQPAIKAFALVPGYADAPQQLRECWYQLGLKRYDAAQFDHAAEAFLQAGDYRDAPDLMEDAHRHSLRAPAVSLHKPDAPTE